MVKDRKLNGSLVLTIQHHRRRSWLTDDETGQSVGGALEVVVVVEGSPAAVELHFRGSGAGTSEPLQEVDQLVLTHPRRNLE